MKFLILALCFVAAVTADAVVIDKFMRPTGADRFFNLFKAINLAKNQRVVGGNESVPHSHPYQVGLLLTIDGGTAFCGGSLISTNFVLTAAHCVYDGRITVQMWTIVLGAHNIYDEDNSIRYQSRTAIMHPGWNPSVLQNDLAVIRIPVSVELNDKVQLINLPPYSAVGSSFSGSATVVSGWGKAADSDTAISPVLREANLDVISNTVCNVNFVGVIQSTMVCTSGSAGSSSCNGDSGGPLTTIYKGKKIEIGIVSFGLALGCERGWPAVYTRVTSYLDWISTTTSIPIQP